MTKEKKNLLVFGYGLAVIITFLVWRHETKQGGSWGPLAYGLLGLALIFAVVTTINYRLLKPVYDRWMAAAHVIGAIVSGALLTILFFIVFTLIGIILRLMQKDLLDRKINKKAASYWIRRTQKFDPKACTQQF